ncbi:hypothetical protein ANANG_G00145030 [Anguilla anguilla]|uniref:Uncharacterized protein n=1 Tax=Anguilla anguilla TaxID=7936 RepID=A0A9D3MHC8_ANGAN|nr:hypothetical protein ANANG_G00145030 [Anguilla anguilla]
MELQVRKERREMLDLLGFVDLKVLLGHRVKTERQDLLVWMVLKETEDPREKEGGEEEVNHATEGPQAPQDKVEEMESWDQREPRGRKVTQDCL